MNIAAVLATPDFRVTGTVSLAHGTSHFYQMALPPLFPLLKVGLGVSYTELGLMMSLLFVCSTLSQFFSGFLVDRFGARPVLFSGVLMMAGGTLCAAFVPNIFFLYGLAIIIGIGNGTFHPSDFAVLNENVNERHLGYAFAAHGGIGAFGYAAAPVVSYALSSWLGWRTALIIMGIVGLLVLVFLIWQRQLLYTPPAKKRPVAAHHDQQTAGRSNSWLQRATILCCLFLLFQSFGGAGVQQFTPSVLHDTFSLSLGLATYAVTAYLLGSGTGVLSGGYFASRAASHTTVAVSGMAVSGALALAILWLVPLGSLVLIPAFFVMGFALGATGPSRDLIVRSVAPKGALGRVYGFVYSGMDIGSTLAPLAFGLLLDNLWGTAVYPVIGVAMLLAIVTTINVRPGGR